jgi:hypothetical protein
MCDFSNVTEENIKELKAVIDSIKQTEARDKKKYHGTTTTSIPGELQLRGRYCR